MSQTFFSVPQLASELVFLMRVPMRVHTFLQMPRQAVQWQYQQSLCFFCGAPVVFLLQIIYICIYVFRPLEMLVLVYKCTMLSSVIFTEFCSAYMNAKLRIPYRHLHVTRLTLGFIYKHSLATSLPCCVGLLHCGLFCWTVRQMAQWRGESKQTWLTIRWVFGFAASGCRLFFQPTLAKVSLQWAWATLRCSCFVPRKCFFVGVWRRKQEVENVQIGQRLNRYFGYLTDKHACFFRWNDTCLSIPVLYHAINRVLMTFIPLLRSSRLRSS